MSEYYFCIYCNKKFKNPYFLQKHYLKKHKKYYPIKEILEINKNYVKLNDEIEKLRNALENFSNQYY